MDLQSRKLEFIKEFLKVQSDEVLTRLENILRSNPKNSENDGIVPMSTEEFNARIDQSMEDSKNGRIIESGELKAKIEKWN